MCVDSIHKTSQILYIINAEKLRVLTQASDLFFDIYCRPCTVQKLKHPSA